MRLNLNSRKGAEFIPKKNAFPKGRPKIDTELKKIKVLHHEDHENKLE